jgi:hypothetical protein
LAFTWVDVYGSLALFEALYATVCSRFRILQLASALDRPWFRIKAKTF